MVLVWETNNMLLLRDNAGLMLRFLKIRMSRVVSERFIWGVSHNF